MAVARDAKLNAVMVEAGLRGSVGSVALLMKVKRRRVFVEVLDTQYFDARVGNGRSRYAGKGDGTLQGTGVRIWRRRVLRWLIPAKIIGFNVCGTLNLSAGICRCVLESAAQAEEDPARTTRHGLGFVPLVWIKNFPGGNRIDGACTFRSAIDTSIEIDYQLSQAGRGLKYSSDPTLLIREPAGLDGTMVRGAANALVVSEKGDAKLLEIGGTASQAVIDYVRVLRDLALETLHGNRADAQRLTAPASGRAMELMNQGLVWLADNLRVSYGQCALVELARMILRASQVFPLRAGGMDLPALDVGAPISLRWPDWYPDDALDGQRTAETLISLVNAKQLSRETALRIIASDYDIEDVSAELQRIKAEGTG